MQLRGARIAGLGAYVPDKRLTNEDLTRIVETTDQWIVEHTGISERRIIADDQVTSDLAYEASLRAIADAGISRDQIGLIIVCTVSSDTPFPATAAVLQHKLGISGVGTFDLVSGCTGWVQGLITGSQFVQSGAFDYVLVVGAEALTRITNWTDRSTCVLFGDGAGAAVIGPCEPGEGLLSFAMDTLGEAGPTLTIPAGGSAQRLTPELLAQHKDCIYMQGHDVFKLAVRGCPEIADKALQTAGLEHRDVDVFVMHQANLRIIDAAAKRLDVPSERIVVNLDRYGNTSAASVGIALDEHKREKGLHPGDIVLLVAFGAGFSLVSAVFKWA